jgi:hypothetical protein
MEMTSTWYSFRRVANIFSDYKVFVEESTDRILGAQILGSEAGEVVNLFALAIRSGMRHRFTAHAVCVPDEWLKYGADALEGSRGDHDAKIGLSALRELMRHGNRYLNNGEIDSIHRIV